MCVVTLIVLNGIAILIGRIQHPPQDIHMPALPRHQPVTGQMFPVGDRDLRLLDTETGELQRVRIPSGGHLENASSSPWRDGLERTHVVGLWKGVHPRGAGAPSGLARFALPGWEQLDRLECHVVPTSPACWFPDRSSRILFTSLDGRLYRFDFDGPSGDHESNVDESGRLQLVSWQVPQPAGALLLSQPNWPFDPRLGGKLFVRILFAKKKTGVHAIDHTRSCSQIWWLQLDPDCSKIVGAGKLIADRPDDSEAIFLEELYPAVAPSAGGNLLLAYQARRVPESIAHLWLAPITIDRSGTPRVERAEAVKVMPNSLLATPIFSRDGRSIYGIPRIQPAPERAIRFAVAALLPRMSLAPPRRPPGRAKGGVRVTENGPGSGPAHNSETATGEGEPLVLPRSRVCR